MKTFTVFVDAPNDESWAEGWTLSIEANTHYEAECKAIAMIQKAIEQPECKLEAEAMLL